MDETMKSARRELEEKFLALAKNINKNEQISGASLSAAREIAEILKLL